MLIAPFVRNARGAFASLPNSASPIETARLMRNIINDSKIDPLIVHAAHHVTFFIAEHDEFNEARAIYEWVRDAVRYTRDIQGLETISTPQLTMRRMTGDCDDQTVLLCAMLESIGFETRLVLAQYRAEDFEHVYPQVLIGNRWITCDPILRSKFFGYEIPNAVKVWYERN